MGPQLDRSRDLEERWQESKQGRENGTGMPSRESKGINKGGPERLENGAPRVVGRWRTKGDQFS